MAHAGRKQQQETLAMKKQTLTVQEIIRAWKDKNFRDSLSEEQRAQLPANPAGLVEIEDAQLVQVAGGAVYSGTCK
jgi:mersacidin/lichenicidin family type 2 lantibiotic